ncbi:M15 family metallopeptidase, partial [Actinotalea sp. AC32]|nr:M15 family metallopeptidase [Actinotalea sp. AC32]
DLLRRLTELLPQVVQVVQAATARETVAVGEREGRAHVGERSHGRTDGRAGEHAHERAVERAAEDVAARTTERSPSEGADAEASDGAASGRGPPPSPTTDRTTDRTTDPDVPRPRTTADATALVPLPDRSALNVGVSPCPTSLLVSRFGPPRDLVGDECRALTSPWWESRMVTGQVGTARVRGHHLAVELFGRAFTALAEVDPELHARVGSTGMLCVRHVRGRPEVLSNHALGLALDVTLDGTVDIRGDDQVQRGLVTLHDVLAPFGIFWGAGTRPEDAIHFEVGAEVVHRWLDEGIF